MPTDEQPVSSSETSEPSAPVVTSSLDRLTTEERSTWRKTGTLPDALQADSSPATPDKAVSTETTAPPASEPGTPKPKKNAESRIQELLQERAQLRQELDAARRPVTPTQPQTPAASSPAPVPVAEKFPDFDTWSAKTPDASYEDYIDARAAHVFEQKQQAHERQAAEVEAQKSRDQQMTDYRTKAEAFIAEQPDYLQAIQPVITAAIPLPVKAAIEDGLARAGHNPRLLYHLGTHLDEFEALIALPPSQAAYELGQLSARLSVPASPVVKTLSTAPDPPPTLRSKPATPVDEVEAAVKRGDFASYRLAMNRKAIAK